MIFLHVIITFLIKCSFLALNAEGTAAEEFHDHVSKEIKGKTITRNGTDDNPAFYVERGGKTGVLKKASELEKLESSCEPVSGGKQKANTQRQRDIAE